MAAAALGLGLSSSTLLADATPTHADILTEPRPSPPGRPFTSSPLYSHPDRRGVTVVTAESLGEIVDDRAKRNSHVLIEIFNPSCHACERLAPIIDQVGAVAAAVNEARTGERPSLTVAVMDESTNHKPGFLTREEERYLPIIKFFPAHSATACTYQGPHNTLAILKFINSHLPDSEKMSLTDIAPLVESTNATTQSQLDRVYEMQRTEEIRYDPTIQLFDQAPCGTELATLMKEMILGRYRSLVSESEQQAAKVEREQKLARFNQCVKKSAERTVTFWSKVAELANSQLEQSKKALEEQCDGGNESEESDDSSDGKASHAPAHTGQ